jgi:carbamoylphosphate synthase large subunit
MGVMSKDKVTILVGFAEALAGPESIWSLINNGMRVIAFSRVDRKTPMYQNRNIEVIKVCPPENDIKQSLKDIVSIVLKYKPDYLLPLDDSGVWVCKTISTQMHIKNVGPDDKQADFALDKRLQIEVAQKSGIKIIPSLFINTKQDLYQIVDFPVLLKPALVRIEKNGKLISGRQYRCSNKSELLNVAQTWNESYPMLAQQIIQGVGEGIFGLVTEKGVKAWTAHRRIRMMNPLGSGSSACESIEILDQPIKQIERMVSVINWKGLFMIEMIRDNKDQLWFMEMNGRTWGSMALARRQGYEYPAWSVLAKLDYDFEPVIPKVYEKIICRHLGREILHVLMVLRGHRGSSISSWPSISKTMKDFFTIKQNHRWYNLEQGKTLFFIKDTLLTIFDSAKNFFGIK